MPAQCPACGTVLMDDRLCERCSNRTGARPLAACSILSSPRISAVQVRGIGGSLILVAISLIFSPLLLGFSAVTDIRFLSSPGRHWISRLVPGISTFLAFELLTIAIMLAAYICLLVLFFREKRSFPRWFQLFVGATAVIDLVKFALCPRAAASAIDNLSAVALAARLHTTLAYGAARASVAVVIWIGYFAVSRRVKATFVN